MKIRFIILFFILQISFILNAQNDNFKALFIHNVSNFIEWPSYTESFHVKIFGKSQVTLFLNNDPKLKTRKVMGLPVKVTEIDTITDVYNCNILFVTNSNSDQIKDIAERLKGRPTLIITDDSVGEPVTLGACINFYTNQQNKLIMQISKNNILSHRLKLDSQLLYLGEVID